MAKKTEKKSAPKKGKWRVSLGLAAPLIKIGGDVLFGRPDVQWKGALQTAKESGSFKAGLAQGAHIMGYELVGRPFAGGGGTNYKFVMENVGVTAAGYVAHRVADKVGVNTQARRITGGVVSI